MARESVIKSDIALPVFSAPRLLPILTHLHGYDSPFTPGINRAAPLGIAIGVAMQATTFVVCLVIIQILPAGSTQLPAEFPAECAAERLFRNAPETLHAGNCRVLLIDSTRDESC
ncbi:hypothetical protein [Nitrosovibrio sp. Nv4]|uniref:hypothetical protein n=1 Tax=Nitrosovibrio sp. Nv4 TaxID=1945880 RepID=UPI000BD9175F|nr:hypothetical protein [Nitrosovibrio sp. Nv4]SOD40656.1 hypothetical protein SAMN06298226_0931 [Nitrosovibrio sp. Nv4]